MPGSGWAVGLCRRDDELAAAANAHSGNAVLPAFDEPAQGNSMDSLRFHELSNSSPVSYSTPT